MQISLSTNSFLGLGKPKECISGLLETGFKRITFDLKKVYSSAFLENYGVEEMKFDSQRAKTVVGNFLEECKKSSMILDVVRAPHLKWDTKRADMNDLMLQIGKDSIEVCKKINAKNIVIQPLFAGIAKQNMWKENRRYYRELGKVAQENNISVLFENQCVYKRERFVRGVCSGPIEASEWIDTLNKEFGDEIFGFCLDICAGTLCRQDVGAMAVELGNRLKAVILRENDGFHEMSRLPFVGRYKDGEGADWSGIINGLRKIEFDGTLILDAGDTLRNFSHLLHPYLYPLMRSVADYIGWQIELEKRIKRYPQRVLFGAGNMCRNYMEYYGEKYPPLFICDNNPALWGMKVYNLEVQSPEALKGLPKGCAVIICNTFYEETFRQVTELGVENVETFSDEYLPFNFGRRL